MTDTTDTTTEATEPVDTEATEALPATMAEASPEHVGAVADLLGRLRLEANDHHFGIVTGWLDDLEHNKTPAVSEGAADEPTTEPAPENTTGEGGEVAAEGEAVPPIASGDAVDTPAATASEEPAAP